MTIHAGLLGSLPTDITSFKLAALSFTVGMALITAILLANTFVDTATSILRPSARREPESFDPLHGPHTLWRTRAPRTRSVLPPFPWATAAATPVSPTAISALRPLGEPHPLAAHAHGPCW